MYLGGGLNGDPDPWYEQDLTVVAYSDILTRATWVPGMNQKYVYLGDGILFSD
jgi:hypothetical protein